MRELARPQATLMSVEQAADFLGLAVSTLNKWRCYGDGPTFIKMGRSVRYRISDLNDYVENRQAESTSHYQ